MNSIDGPITNTQNTILLPVDEKRIQFLTDELKERHKGDIFQNFFAWFGSSSRKLQISALPYLKYAQDNLQELKSLTGELKFDNKHHQRLLVELIYIYAAFDDVESLQTCLEAISTEIYDDWRSDRCYSTVNDLEQGLRFACGYGCDTIALFARYKALHMHASANFFKILFRNARGVEPLDNFLNAFPDSKKSIEKNDREFKSEIEYVTDFLSIQENSSDLAKQLITHHQVEWFNINRYREMILKNILGCLLIKKQDKWTDFNRIDSDVADQLNEYSCFSMLNECFTIETTINFENLHFCFYFTYNLTKYGELYNEWKDQPIPIYDFQNDKWIYDLTREQERITKMSKVLTELVGMPKVYNPSTKEYDYRSLKTTEFSLLKLWFETAIVRYCPETLQALISLFKQQYVEALNYRDDTLASGFYTEKDVLLSTFIVQEISQQVVDGKRDCWKEIIKIMPWLKFELTKEASNKFLLMAIGTLEFHNQVYDPLNLHRFLVNTSNEKEKCEEFTAWCCDRTLTSSVRDTLLRIILHVEKILNQLYRKLPMKTLQYIQENKNNRDLVVSHISSLSTEYRPVIDSIKTLTKRINNIREALTQAEDITAKYKTKLSQRVESHFQQGFSQSHMNHPYFTPNMYFHFDNKRKRDNE